MPHTPCTGGETLELELEHMLIQHLLCVPLFQEEMARCNSAVGVQSRASYEAVATTGSDAGTPKLQASSSADHRSNVVHLRASQPGHADAAETSYGGGHAASSATASALSDRSRVWQVIRTAAAGSQQAAEDEGDVEMALQGRRRGVCVPLGAMQQTGTRGDRVVTRSVSDAAVWMAPEGAVVRLGLRGAAASGRVAERQTTM